MNHFHYFLDNRLNQLNFPESYHDTVNVCKQVIVDQDYFNFISFVGNGGFFFGQSLQIYDLGKSIEFNNILAVNRLLGKEFDFLFKDLFSFGQDIFGNQFVFEKGSSNIAFFNIESGAKEPLAENFLEWLDVLVGDLEYLTGRSYEQQWKVEHNLPLEHRLQPKFPFVIGGEYSVSNFFTSPYPNYISYNADIAKQIVNLKDGEKVKLNIKY